MVECDGCREWFHKGCVQIPWTSYEPNTNEITNYVLLQKMQGRVISNLKL